MIPALSRIWEECFGDSPEYIRFFMERRFPTCQSFVWLEQGEPVGVAYLLPCMIGERQAYYGYAIGVKPEFQRRGICAEILHCAEQFCKRKRAVFFVVPRSGVEKYYANRGFCDAFYYNKRKIYHKGESSEVLMVVEAVPAEYSLLRNEFFQGTAYVRWDAEAVKYALEEQRFFGGFAHILLWQGRRYLLFGDRREKEIYLRETTLPITLISQLSANLCDFYRVDEITVEYPAFSYKKRRLRGCCWNFRLYNSGWLGLDLT